MSIRNYSPLGVFIFILLCAGAHYTQIIPVAPIALIAFAGLTGIAFQLEDGKLSRMLGEFFAARSGDHTHHVH